MCLQQKKRADLHPIDMSLPDAENGEQEKRSLRMVDDYFSKLLVVGEHTKLWSDENGIQMMSIYDFLLDWSSTEKQH